MTYGKRFYILAALPALVFGLSATPLSPEQALQRARQEGTQRLSAGQYELARTFSAGGSAAVYLFRSPGGGYMAVSADDCALPLLGYGDLTGDSLPPAMLWWLNGLAGEVAQAAPTGRKPARGIRTEKAPVQPMLTTRWDQGAPYNDLCPELDGKKTYTGCAATAMAQVMNCMRYPAAGSRSVSYQWQGQTLSMNFAETTFDWDNMADSYSPVCTDAQKTAVATLMKACGYALKSDYGTTATEAKTSDIVPALVRNFGYARSTRLLYRRFHQLAAWQDSVYASLTAGSPVLYTGQGSAGGHAFVCDGYQSDGFFHFNWGWSGKSDGWFRLSALDPEALGTGGGAGGFNSGQTAVTHLQKAYTGAAYVPAMGTGDNYSIACNADASVLTLSGGLYNYAVSAMNYSAGFSIEPLEGGETRYIGAGNWNLTEMLTGYGSYTREVGSALPKGKYRVRAAYQWRDASGTAQWLTALVPVSAPEAWILTVGDTVSITPQERDVALSATGWQLTSPAFALRPGLNVSLEAGIANSGSEEATTDVYALLCRNGSSSPAYTLPATTMTIAPGGKADYSFYGALPAAMKPGHYAVYLGVKPYGSEKYRLLTDSIGVEVLDPCEAITLKTPAWQLHDAAMADGDRLKVDMTLVCTKGCYANVLLFFFQNKNDDGTFTTFGSTRSQPLWINTGDTAHYSFEMAMPEYKPKTAYRLVVNYKNAEGKNTYLCRTEFTTLSALTPEADGDDPVLIPEDSGTLLLCTPHRVTELYCYGIDGRRLALQTCETGRGTSISTRQLLPGIYLLRCTLADGTAHSFKFRR